MKAGVLIVLSLGLLVSPPAGVGAQDQSPQARESGEQPTVRAPQSPGPEVPRPLLPAPQVLLPANSTPRLIKFSGELRDASGRPRTGAVALTFSIYKDQEGGSSLWTETHTVQCDDQGHYEVLLGSRQGRGMPLELFAIGEPRWLGVKVELPGEVEQPRVLLVSVPYALKASDADTLGGKPTSAYALASTAATGTSTTGAPAEGAGTGTGGAKPTKSTNKAVGNATTMNFIPMFTNSTGALGNSVMIQSGSSIGVGTAPVQAFDVNGGIRGTGLATGSRGTAPDAINTAALFLGGSNAMGLVGTNTAAFAPGALFTKASFYAGGVERMTVDGTTGNVGIGTTTPAQTLDVAGNVRVARSGAGVIFPDGTMRTSANSISGVLSVSGDIQITTPGNGIVVKSPDGTQCKTIGIDNTGSLAVIPCSLTFVQGATLSSGIAHPKDVVVADFNGDGKLDIAVSNFETNTIAVFLNDGTGNFGAPIVTKVQLTSAMGLNVGALAVGDFNEDGKPDLVVATIAGSQVSIVLLGNGDGTFRQQAPIPNSFGFLHAKVGDLNGDGHQDLVFALDGSIAVSLGNGDGTFGAMTVLPSGSFPGLYFGLAVADFNGDGKLDIAATDFGSPSGGTGTLVFYAGNGDGTFGKPTSVSLPASFPGSLASADFNGDGKQDIIIGYPNAGVIAFGNGDGTFGVNTPEFVYSTNSFSSSNVVYVYASDLTRIGKPDAITADFDAGALQITLNSALGQFPPYKGIYSFALAPGISAVATGDLNGDGVLDVVVANYTAGQINIILSKIQ
jgi:hypothetical protein